MQRKLLQLTLTQVSDDKDINRSVMQPLDKTDFSFGLKYQWETTKQQTNTEFKVNSYG